MMPIQWLTDELFRANLYRSCVLRHLVSSVYFYLRVIETSGKYFGYFLCNLN